MEQEQLAAVGAAAAQEAGVADPTLLGGYLSRLATAAQHGHRLDEDALADARASGGRAAEGGVALQALVDLYLSATWRAWRGLAAVRAATNLEAVHAVGEAVLRAADDAVAAAADGYQSARRWIIRREEAARREFVDDVLAGAGDVASLLERGEQFGLDLARSHWVVVVAAAAPFRDATPTLSRVEEALAGTAGGVRSLVTSKDGQLVCILPAGRAAEADRMLQAVVRVVRTGEGDHESAPAGASAGPPSWRAGVGRAFGGAAGIRRSYDEARESIAIASRLPLADPVTKASDMLVYQVLLRDHEAIADLIETVLRPLKDARGGAAPLLDTLIAYFASGANAAATARDLHLSVRAVTYRLERIRQLTGYDPADPHQSYVLQTAALGARILGESSHAPLPLAP